MFKCKRLILSILICLSAITMYSQRSDLDVLSYHLSIEPDIQNQHIMGNLTINFQVSADTKQIALDAGELEIDKVSGTSVAAYTQTGSKLVIDLSSDIHYPQNISVGYHGYPNKGLLFDPDLNQAHTVFSTDQWMVCNNDPNDRATFSLQILLPQGMQSIASGKHLGEEESPESGKVIHKWHQAYETPSYTFGFVIGSFTEATEQIGDVNLNYYSSELNESELQKVFTETGNILEFFEQKSGIDYIQDSYSQVLIGNYYQEMSGLSVFNTSYPSFVFKDSSEIHLTSHELAHQWWGNMITCEDYGHFWLNEAFAVYMSSAFSEHRFGKEKYNEDILIYKGIYDDVVEKGMDRSLIFEKWEPTKENRRIAYYKGAYVLHLLREELGDEDFWKGIRYYSQTYFGKSVTTEAFKTAMEEATDKSLNDFFSAWVY